MGKNIVNQRFINCVNFLIETKKAPSKSFLAEKFNISSSKFSEILKERMNVGVDVLMILTSEFGVSSEWLLTGQGSMLKNTEVEVSSSQPQENDKYIVSLEKQIALLEKNIALLEKENAYQVKEIQRLEKALQQHKKTTQSTMPDVLHQSTR